MSTTGVLTQNDGTERCGKRVGSCRSVSALTGPTRTRTSAHALQPRLAPEVLQQQVQRQAQQEARRQEGAPAAAAAQRSALPPQTLNIQPPYPRKKERKIYARCQACVKGTRAWLGPPDLFVPDHSRQPDSDKDILSEGYTECSTLQATAYNLPMLCWPLLCSAALPLLCSAPLLYPLCDR